MDQNTTQPQANQGAAVLVGSGTLLGELVFSGCKEHPHRLDLSCAKIRRADRSALTDAEAWAEITRMRDALAKIAKQETTYEMDDSVYHDADMDAGYDACINEARKALSPNAQGEPTATQTQPKGDGL